MKAMEDLFKASEENAKRIERHRAYCAGCKLCQLQEDGLRHIGEMTYTKDWVLVPAVPEPLGELEAEVLGKMVRSFQNGSIDKVLASLAQGVKCPLFGDPLQWAEGESDTTLQYLLAIYAIYMNRTTYPALTQEQKGRLLLDRVIKVRFKEGVE